MEMYLVYPEFVDYDLEELKKDIIEALRAYFEGETAETLAEKLARDPEELAATGVNGVCYDFSCIDEYLFDTPLLVDIPMEVGDRYLELACEVRAVVRTWKSGEAELESVEVRCPLPVRGEKGFREPEEGWRLDFLVEPSEVFGEQKEA